MNKYSQRTSIDLMQQWLNIPYDNHDLHGPETGISRVMITYPNDPCTGKSMTPPNAGLQTFMLYLSLATTMWIFLGCMQTAHKIHLQWKIPICTAVIIFDHNTLTASLNPALRTETYLADKACYDPYLCKLVSISHLNNTLLNWSTWSTKA